MAQRGPQREKGVAWEVVVQKVVEHGIHFAAGLLTRKRHPEVNSSQQLAHNLGAHTADQAERLKDATTEKVQQLAQTGQAALTEGAQRAQEFLDEVPQRAEALATTAQDTARRTGDRLLSRWELGPYSRNRQPEPPTPTEPTNQGE